MTSCCKGPLYGHLPTPCAPVDIPRGCGVLIEDLSENPSNTSHPSLEQTLDLTDTSHPSLARKNGVAPMQSPVTEPPSEGCPVVGDCPRCDADQMSLVQRHGQPACVACSLLSDDELAQRCHPMSTNGTHAPSPGLPLHVTKAAHGCPQCGCIDLMDCVTYRKCPVCSWKEE